MLSYDIAGVIGIVGSARILLNIRDVMSISVPTDDVPGNPWGIEPITFNTMWGSNSGSGSGSHDRAERLDRDGNVITLPEEDWEMEDVDSGHLSQRRSRPRIEGASSLEYTHETTPSLSDANLEYGLGMSSVPGSEDHVSVR